MLCTAFQQEAVAGFLSQRSKLNHSGAGAVWNEWIESLTALISNHAPSLRSNWQSVKGNLSRSLLWKPVFSRNCRVFNLPTRMLRFLPSPHLLKKDIFQRTAPEQISFQEIFWGLNGALWMWELCPININHQQRHQKEASHNKTKNGYLR